MGLYAKFVLPRLIELAMKNPEAARLRAAWIHQARGRVLEVGVGSGLNLPFYSPEVERIYAVDPSIELQRIALTRAPKSIPIDFLTQSAESPLPIAGASIDTAVVTWSLCSIPDAGQALLQIKRALKPDGTLVFIEHGQSSDRTVARWQDRLTPVWKRIAGGCRLNLPITELIEAAGFRITKLETGYVAGPRPMTYTYQGSAEITSP